MYKGNAHKIDYITMSMEHESQSAANLIVGLDQMCPLNYLNQPTTCTFVVLISSMYFNERTANEFDPEQPQLVNTNNSTATQRREIMWILYAASLKHRCTAASLQHRCTVYCCISKTQVYSVLLHL